MASLFIISGDQKGDFYPLGVRTNVVGRDEALPMQVLDDLASRKHLQIRYDKQRSQSLRPQWIERNWNWCAWAGDSQHDTPQWSFQDF